MENQRSLALKLEDPVNEIRQINSIIAMLHDACTSGVSLDKKLTADALFFINNELEKRLNIINNLI